MPRRMNKSVVWEYFDRIDDKRAECHACRNSISYKSTTNNLKSHLKTRHPLAFTELQVKQSKDGNAPIKREDEDSNESDQLSPEVWNFFEQETGGRARCIVCRITRPNNVEDLRNHLTEKHPKLLNGNIQEAVVSEESGDEDGGNYTEVIYVEEDTKGNPSKYYVKEPKHSSKKKEHRLKKEQKLKRPERERRFSVSSDDLPIKRRRTEERSEPDQLDSFLTYIKCLLRQVPNDVCAKLQMGIVNLIMKEKLKVVTEVPENSMSVSREVNIERADVISVALADADIAPLSESNHCYIEDKDEN